MTFYIITTGADSKSEEHLRKQLDGTLQVEQQQNFFDMVSQVAKADGR